ncbi:MAG: hypothetical protein GDA53_09770 [Rhodobacteraceae bacterium]|nr:hypothetical protein [Paracoccaceae bacterium]
MDERVVIQCARSKNAAAPSLKAKDGHPVRFVARPECAPDDGAFYARPDDVSPDNMTWRDKLLRYNQTGANPLGLLPAAGLYRPPIYGALAAALPASRLFILSAGWGLIRADFLTPAYDITFSAQAAPLSRRQKSARWQDMCALDPQDSRPLVFFGGKDYLPLFRTLTGRYQGKRTVFFNSAAPPEAPGCALRKFETSRKTNWHYECAQAFLDGRLGL